MDIVAASGMSYYDFIIRQCFVAKVFINFNDNIRMNKFDSAFDQLFLARIE